MGGKSRPNRTSPGAPEGARRATGGAPGVAPDADRGRFSARRKAEAVLRLLRGEELDALSREFGVTAATLSVWREEFLAAGQAGLKSRQPSLADEEIQKLKTLIGELTIDNECLKALIRTHENRSPFGPRRSSP